MIGLPGSYQSSHRRFHLRTGRMQRSGLGLDCTFKLSLTLLSLFDLFALFVFGQKSQRLTYAIRYVKIARNCLTAQLASRSLYPRDNRALSTSLLTRGWRHRARRRRRADRCRGRPQACRAAPAAAARRFFFLCRGFRPAGRCPGRRPRGANRKRSSPTEGPRRFAHRRRNLDELAESLALRLGRETEQQMRVLAHDECV